jgi:ABC-type multidrug transport system fused ATPase/permease subunit
VAQELRASRGAMLTAAVSTLLVALADLARPWPLKVIFDQVLLGKPASGYLAGVLALLGSPAAVVVAFSASIVLIAVVTGAFAYLQVHVTSRLSNLVVCRLRRELFAHLQRLSLSTHHRTQSGEMLTRISRDTQALKDTFTESAIAFAAQAITIVGCISIMLALSWQLTAIVLATLPLLFWNLFRLYRASRDAARRQRSKEATLTTQITQALSSAALIQAFGRERHETERFNRQTGEHLAHSISHARFEAMSARSVEVISAAATALVVLFGALEVLGGRMTPGTVLVFSTYLHSLYRPIRQLAKLSSRMSSAAVSAQRINDVLELAPEIEDAPDAIEAQRLEGSLVFDRVSFEYPGEAGSTEAPRRPGLLHDITFRIAPGTQVALVGASGSGKSTIASLILRLYDPTSGSIAIGGVDIRKYRRESLRRSVAVVLQDSLILGVSVRENIAYGKLDATDAEIEAAARAANAHAFIAALPRGYDTVLGERGATLSGGQRQRLAIARAMIRNAPILLLDEPMTGLDRRSQARVQRAVARAARGRTCLVITHDVETAAAADTVLVLHEGQIVDSGTHRELVERSRAYRALLNIEADRPSEVSACA